MLEPASAGASLQRTALHPRQLALGARMVPFAGYEMPVQFKNGIIAEHSHTRTAAGLFDVSHMGQAILSGPDYEITAKALEKLVPGDILGLRPGRIRYTQLTNSEGGIIDDLMVARLQPADAGKLMLVVNASRKSVDYAWIEQNLPRNVSLIKLADRSLLALQGPKSEMVLSRHCPDASALAFMQATPAKFADVDVNLARCGYTGEDGYELSVATGQVASLYDLLLADTEVQPVGLGARDSLRLEAGLCLYGHDIDEATSPVEAGLAWSIGKRRRVEGGFSGAARILRELEYGPRRCHVGLLLEGRAPAREGSSIRFGDKLIGRVTSGGFGPTLGRPIAMGYVDAEYSAIGTSIDLIVRDRPQAATIIALPFVPHRYKKIDLRRSQ
jgi:aminomethyltransferase